METKIIIAGGTGFLGQSLAKRFNKSGFRIIILTRAVLPATGNISYVQWDGLSLDEWVKELSGCFALINLVGKSVNCRYTEKNKQEIIASRVNATLILGKAIQQTVNPPKVWINASSEAIFGDAGDMIKYEDSPLGEGFSASVCKLWEDAFYSIPLTSTRKVLLRMGLVFQRKTGLLQPFINLVKTGLGGRIGTGRQYISWIHEEDFLTVVQMILQTDTCNGIVHCSSPFPVTNKQFMKALRKALNMPFGIYSPSWLVKAGAVMIKTQAELVLTGRRVVSKVLTENNVCFQFPLIEDALVDLVRD